MSQYSLDRRSAPPRWRTAIAWVSIACWVTAAAGATGVASAADVSGGPPAAQAKAIRTNATVPGDPRFFNYASPPGIADNAGEPSIGSNWTSEQAFSNSNGPIPNGGAANYFG